MDDKLNSLSFQVLGSPEFTFQTPMAKETGPTLVIIDGKLVKATDVIQPSLTLTGLEGSAHLGELVVLEAKLTGEYPQFIKSAKIKWTVTENGQPKQCWNDGRKIIFGAGVRNTRIDVNAVLTLNYTVGTDLVAKTVTTSTVVTVGGGPNPGPVPTPTSVAAVVSAWAKDPTIVQPDGLMLKTGAHALSKSFKSLSQVIGKSPLVTIRAILTQTKNNNNEALIGVGVNPQVWDNWGKNLQELLFVKYTNKELVTTDQFKKTWWEISSGLWTVGTP